MVKAVLFDCYNTLLRYESQEDKERIWEMMLEAIQYMTEKKLTVTPKELEILYQKACDTEERKCIKERGPHAEVSFSRAWLEVLTKLNIPKKMAEEKAEDDMIPSGKFGCHCVMIGRQKKEDPALAHVTHFNPYKESGYAGLCDIIVTMKK